MLVVGTLENAKKEVIMPLEIIGHPRSNFVRAVRMVALEKGVQHEHTPELPHSDVIKTLHPMGQIPAMGHEGLELFESMAIARYIDEVFDGPKMVPDEPSKAAKIVQWSSFALCPDHGRPSFSPAVCRTTYVQ